MGSDSLRPFGSSAVDGFDLDFEAVFENVAHFVTQLRALMDADKAKTGKDWLLTAAPQCPYPDQADKSFLEGCIYLDAIWVQFYNNKCGLQSFQANSSQQSFFNFATWDNWARNISKNKSIRVFLSVPGSQSAATNGFKSALDLQPILEYCKQFPSFGGVMVWDASQAFANRGFLSLIRKLLGRDERYRGCPSVDGRTGI